MDENSNNLRDLREEFDAAFEQYRACLRNLLGFDPKDVNTRDGLDRIFAHKDTSMNWQGVLETERAYSHYLESGLKYCGAVMNGYGDMYDDLLSDYDDMRSSFLSVLWNENTNEN